MSHETRNVALGDLVFTVDVAGPENAAPVLMLHGFPETRHMWRHQRDALSNAGYRVIVPDQRGYSKGARPRETDSYTTDLLVADALGLMDLFGAERFHLVGHDWGGQLSWLIAASQPSRFVSLSIFSRPHPAAFARAMQEDTKQSSRSGHHRAFREADAVKRMREAKLEPLRNALTAQGVPEADADVYVTALLDEGAIEGAMNWYRASGIAAASTPAVTVPTLYVWGNEDATVGRRAAELTKEYVAGPYSFVEIEGAGHFTPDQVSERVSELLLAHIRANGGR